MKRALVMLCLLSGCIKPGPVVTAPLVLPVSMGEVLASMDGGLQALPGDVSARLAEEVAQRGLRAVSVTDEALLKGFGSARLPVQRVRLVAARSEAPGLVLLVDTEAQFDVQVNGRYRWTVDVDLVLGEVGDPEGALTDHFQVPVHLVYQHEGAERAVQDAGGAIARHLGVLLDDRNRAAAGG